MSDLKYSYNDVAICPYCNYEEIDSWEISGDDGETVQHECGSCGKSYLFTRHITYTYTTKAVPCLNDEAPHEWEQMIGAPKEYFVGKQSCINCFSERTVAA